MRFSPIHISMVEKEENWPFKLALPVCGSCGKVQPIFCSAGKVTCSRVFVPTLIPEIGAMTLWRTSFLLWERFQPSLLTRPTTEEARLCSRATTMTLNSALAISSGEVKIGTHNCTVATVQQCKGICKQSTDVAKHCVE